MHFVRIHRVDRNLTSSDDHLLFLHTYQRIICNLRTGQFLRLPDILRTSAKIVSDQDDDDPIKPYKGVRGKAKVRIIDDVKIIHPMTVRIVTKYTGGTDNKIAKKILDGVNDGGSVLLELHPSYYSTWDHSTA